MIGTFLKGKVSDYRHLHLESCSSTNAECLAKAQNGEPGNLWITTNTQTAGKGSRGRSWESGDGNLFASLLLRDLGDPQKLAELTFVAALSARAAIQALADECENQSSIQLKWPNDVLVNGQKCGGILLESILDNSGTVMVIGIGVNCLHHPGETSYPATNLAKEGISVTAENMFEELAVCTAETLKLWDRGRNFASIRSTWLQHAAGIGSKTTVKIPGRDDISGIFKTVDEAGYMMLEKQGGELVQISVADIFFNTIKN